MILPLALALAVGQAPSITADLNRSITFEHRAAAAPTVVASLGKAAGVEMSASPALASDILIVRVENVRIPELMDRIADLTSSEWIRTNDGLFLRRSNSKVQADERALKKYRADKLAVALSKLAKSVPPTRDADELRELARQRRDAHQKITSPDAGDPNAWRRYSEIQKREPLLSLVNEALVAIGPSTLAQIGRGDRVVFSSRPTRLQRQLPAGAVSAVQARMEENRVYRAAQRELGVEEPMEPLMPDASEPEAALALLAVEGEEMIGLGVLEATLAIYDSAGRKIGSSQTSLGPIDEDFEKDLEQDLKPKEGDVEIVFGEESKELVEFATDQRKERQDATVVRWRDRMTHMDRYEPLSYGATDLVFSLGTSLKMNTIAVLPDLFVMLGPSSLGPKLTVRALMTFLNSLPLVTVKEDGTWLTMRPTFLSESRATRTDRQSASKFLAASLKEGWPSLATLAGYVAATDTLSFDNLAIMLSNAVGMRTPFEPISSGDQKWLRFFGRLAPNQLASLRTTGITVGSLAPHQAEPLRQLVFGADPALQSSDSGSARETGGMSSDLRLEPTQTLDGLPGDALVTMTVEPKTLLMTIREPESTFLPQPVELSQAAWEIMASQEPERYPWIRDEKPIVAYRLQQESTVNLVLRLKPGLMAVGVLHDRRAPGPPLAYKDLPEAIRQQLEKQIEAVRKGTKDFEVERAAPPPVAIP